MCSSSVYILDRHLSLTCIHFIMYETIDSRYLLMSMMVILSQTTERNICVALPACRLHMVTWNVATADPVDDVSSLFYLSSPTRPDLYVIG